MSVKLNHEAIQLFADTEPQEHSVCVLDVMAALRKVRITEAGLEEYEIHDLLSGALLSAGIFHSRERSFAPRCRADLWVDGIVIEVKKMRPPRAALFDQVTRYASQECVRAVIVVLERSISLPATICGKPVSVLSLNALWGIAV